MGKTSRGNSKFLLRESKKGLYHGLLHFVLEDGSRRLEVLRG